ncbi:MAG: helix-turn-helix domain-containing protein [Actinomycetia bacterium]|nr:helix-turn-helix domain-containing protein [Actinomycetes bacterium]
MNNNHPQLDPGHHPESRVLIDVPGLAERLGVTQRFVRRLTAEDRVPFLKIGKFVRFDPEEIDHWVDGHREGWAATGER